METLVLQEERLLSIPMDESVDMVVGPFLAKTLPKQIDQLHIWRDILQNIVSPSDDANNVKYNYDMLSVSFSLSVSISIVFLQKQEILKISSKISNNLTAVRMELLISLISEDLSINRPLLTDIFEDKNFLENKSSKKENTLSDYQ